MRRTSFIQNPQPERVIFSIGGMTCAACVHHIETALTKVEGIISATVNLATERATIQYMSQMTTIDDIQKVIADTGYPSVDAVDDDHQATVTNDLNILGLKTAFSLSIAIAIMTSMSVPLIQNTFPLNHNWLLLALATPVQVWGGSQFYIGAWRAITHRTSNMNTLIAIGTSASYLYSVFVTLFHDTIIFDNYPKETYFDTSAMIIGLVLLGRYLEARSKKKAYNSIESLLSLQATTARIIKGNVESDLPIQDLRPSDIILVRPGEKIAADGKVVEGDSWVDESMLTGESRLATKHIGSKVFGATINSTGSFKFLVTHVGKNTILSQIIKLMEEAQGSKAPIQRIADMISKYFVPTVIGISLVVFATWLLLGPPPSYFYSMLTAVAVLIVACPCALGLATPTAIIVATGKAAECGIVIRNAESLETAHKIDIIALDKTGTLTSGKPSVTDIVSNNMDQDDLIKLVASAEHISEHPIGKSIVREADTRNLRLTKISNPKVIPGYGIQGRYNDKNLLIGSKSLMEKHEIEMDIMENSTEELNQQGKTLVYVAIGNRIEGLIAVTDTLNVGALDAIKSFKRRGIEIIMLTGDDKPTAYHIARQLGIERVIANVLPANKVEEIRMLQSENYKVAMVGDGINDSPALAQADLGIAIGTGADLAIANSDMTIIGGDIRNIDSAFSLSNLAMRIIRQNLFWAFFYNILLIPIAAGLLYPIFLHSDMPNTLSPILGEFGFLNPIIAASAMAFSSVAVVLNSLRIRSYTPNT